MAIDSVSYTSNTQAVRAKHDADQAKPDGRFGSAGKDKRRRNPSSGSSEQQAVVNEHGQPTGKLIDTTA